MGINSRSIIFINGVVICCIALAMTCPMIMDIIFYAEKCVKVFIPSILSSIFLGGLMIFSCRTHEKLSLTRRDTFLLVVSVWIITSIVCAFPFYIYKGTNIPFLSALFESVSGITTTGATIYQDVEILPRALNLWRFILHFIGGAGIVAIGIIILPIMRVGGMQLFLTENSDTSERFFPRASQTIKVFLGIYIALIGILAVCLKTSGLGIFDSVCHSISAISTGGFSTKNTGIEFFKSSQAELVMSIGMFVGGMAFLEIVRYFRGGTRSFLTNRQIIGYVRLVLIMVTIPIIITAIKNGESISFSGIVNHIFHTISAITTTGLDFSNSYVQSNMVLILLAIVGGCSGSTAGGIKIFRIQVIYAILKNHIRKTIKPFDVSIPKYQGKKIDKNLTASVISFIAILALVFTCSVVLIEIFTAKGGYEAVYATVSCLFNLGYGADFANFPPFAKFILICDMITGRLEIIPVFVILNRIFWKR